MAHRIIVVLAGLFYFARAGAGAGAFYSPRIVPRPAGKDIQRDRFAGRATGFCSQSVRQGMDTLGATSPSNRRWSAGTCSRSIHSVTGRPRGVKLKLEVVAACWCGARGGIGKWRQRSLRLDPLLAEAEAGTEDAGLQGGFVRGKSSPKQQEGGNAFNDPPKDAEGPLRRFWRRLGVARFFGAGNKMPNLKQLGLYALLSYGFVSNASYGVCVSFAWFATSKKTGLSPLAPGQWQAFLVTYAAFFAINNILRVPRFALAMSLAPAFDRFIAFLMRTTGRGKTFATILCVFVVNILGTLALISTGILLASLLSGVPLWTAAA